MTAEIVRRRKNARVGGRKLSPEQAAAAAMVAEARQRGLELTGPDGLLKLFTKKRQRRLGEVDEMVLSLYAKGLTTGEISAHFSEI
ncbi:transposase, partial [Paractinoplanes toevensis]|uniref:transposase n=1 Tax=Paractinoplanes toevensis TaxID=571911 RepID=UPI001FE41931